LEFVCGDRSR